MIEFAEISIGSGRELGCALCSPGHSSDPVPSGSEEVMARVATAVAEWSGPGPNIIYTGFEPFAHPELPQLVSLASALGVERLQLRTDGGALAAAGNAAGALGAGVRHVEITLLAGDAATHDRLTRTDGLFSAATRGAAEWVEAARGTGARAVLSGFVPLCAHNIDHASAAAAHLASCGAVAVRFGTDGLDRTHVAAVRAALDTATVNAVAGFVTGSLSPEFGVYAVAPWRCREAGE